MAIIVIACLVTGMVVALDGVGPIDESGVRTIDGLEGLWHASQTYNLSMIQSYSVFFYLVTFTLLYVEEPPQNLRDRAIPVHFRVTFLDGSFELLSTTIGGMVFIDPRVVLSNHTNPAAAIVSSMDMEHWYDWYYCVSA